MYPSWVVLELVVESPVSSDHLERQETCSRPPMTQHATGTGKLVFEKGQTETEMHVYMYTCR